MDKFCGTCGQPVIPCDLFCRNCGQSLTATISSTRPASHFVNSAAQVTVKNPYRGKNKQVWGSIMAVVGLFLSVAFCSPGRSLASNDQLEVLPYAISLFLIVAGFGLYYSGKFEHWYHSE